MNKEANEIELENARVEQLVKDVQDRFAATGDTSKINAVIEARKEKTWAFSNVSS